MEERIDGLYATLKRLCLEDPLLAKTTFIRLFNDDLDAARLLMARCNRPSDGRLRHVIARSLVGVASRERVVADLLRWKADESDEFARMAITDALVGLNDRVLPTTSSEFPDLLPTYQYLGERMRHQVRNAIPRAGLSINLLTEELRRIGGDGLLGRLTPQLDDLTETLRSIYREVEFSEGDDHFDWQEVCLHTWLERFGAEYTKRYPRVQFEISRLISDPHTTVEASEHLLGLIFKNLADNSRHYGSNKGETQIRLILSNEGQTLKLTVIDNGPGFNRSDTGWAFRYPPPGANLDRGRGLLEINVAAARLNGKAAVYPITGSGNRVVLTFPLTCL